MDLLQRGIVNRTSSNAAAENTSARGIAFPAVPAFSRQPVVQRMRIDPNAVEFASFKQELQDVYGDAFDEPETSRWDKEFQDRLVALFLRHNLQDKIPLITQPEPVAAIDEQPAPAIEEEAGPAPPPDAPLYEPEVPALAPPGAVPRARLVFKVLPPLPVDNPAYKGVGVLHERKYYAHIAFSNVDWTDLTQKVHLKRIILAAANTNREDVVDFVEEAYEEVKGAKPTWTPEDLALFSKAADAKIPGYKSVDGLHTGATLPHWPLVPGGLTGVAESTMETFKNLAQPGHAFTGLVKFAARTPATEAPITPSIYLHPTQATGDYLKSGILPHPEGPNDSGELVDWNREGKPLPQILREATINGAQPGYYSTHQGQAQSSHLKVQDMTDTPTGLGIGFTVIRGGTATDNKFTFVSRSNNVQIFSALSPRESRELPPLAQSRIKGERGIGEGLNEPPVAWAGHITNSVDAAAR